MNTLKNKKTIININNKYFAFSKYLMFRNLKIEGSEQIITMHGKKDKRKQSFNPYQREIEFYKKIKIPRNYHCLTLKSLTFF